VVDLSDLARILGLARLAGNVVKYLQEDPVDDGRPEGGRERRAVLFEGRKESLTGPVVILFFFIFLF